MVGHMQEKVNRDLFAMVGNLKKIKNCPIPEKFLSFVGKSSFINLNYLSSAFTQTPPIREKLASEIEALEIQSASSF
jgi:hypothetical protein